jgi:hypothetical protein
MYTNNQFHTSQVTIVTESKRVVNKASLAIFSTGIGLCVACLIPSHWVSKLTLIGASCGLFSVSHRLDRLKASLAPYEVSAHIQSQQSYSQWLSTSFAPPKREIAIAQPAPIDTPAPVKFADVKQALSKPHVMLLGSTGDGKSTLAKHLAANCTAYTIVIDPHAAPDDWGNLPVFGGGRKYAEIAEIMQLLLNLLQVRFDARDRGVKQFEPIVIICDEYPAIIASTEAGKVASSWMKLISREARKVAIRLVVLTQSPEVKAIGLEGEGSVRDNFCFVRLGEFALDHAKSLKDDAIKSAIEQADRPAMLGNLPCAIPTLSDRIAMPVLSMPRDYQELIADNAIAPDIEPIDRPLNQQSASTAPALTTSAPSTPNQQSASLSAPLQAIVDYAKRKNEFISARMVQSGIAIFKQSKADEIREYFKYLATLGYGATRGQDENLEFSAN